jgi:DNA-binding NtrC family response regulator
MSRSPAPPEPSVTVAVASRDRVYLDSLSSSLTRRGLAVRLLQAASEGAWGSLEGVDVLVLDTDSLTASDLERAASLRRHHPLVEVVAVAGDSPVSEAVKALRTGVFTVLQHPVADGLLVEALVAAGRRHRHARMRLEQLNGGGRRPESRERAAPADRGPRERGRT